MNRILLTICARSGSKGVPNKNIKLLSGKPLICHTISQAMKWNKAEHVIVSTDSDEIAGIAKTYGAEVPFLRPKILAGDTAPKLPVIRHALSECERIYSERFDIVVDLDPTAPIRKIADLDNSLKLFDEHRSKTLFSVVPGKKNPY